MASAAINQTEASKDIVLRFDYEIEEDVKAELEDFVRLSHTGQFGDAHELYDECLSKYESWYPVAAEYADCLLREGDFEQLENFSRKARMAFEDPSEEELFSLMELIATRTQLLRPVLPVRSLKPPYTSLRDIDIHILEIGLQILVVSNAAKDHTSPGLWDAFKDWFHLLLEHEYFWEAQRILHSLFHKLSLPECEDLVNDFIQKAMSTNSGQESVQIAVSSLVQRFVYVVESKCSSPLTMVQWNDAIHWALFGVPLARAGEESVPLFSRICLRQSLQEYLKPNILLPLNHVGGNDDLSSLLLEAVTKGDLSVLGQAINAEPIHYTRDQLNSAALLKAAQSYTEGTMTSFLNPRTVNTQDGYQRTPLHWACLNGQLQAVELLLRNWKVDTGLQDWFGCTPLHYAERLGEENPEILKLVLEYNSIIGKRAQRTWSPVKSDDNKWLSMQFHEQSSLHNSSPDGLGLSVLYPPTDTGDDDTIVDIVFVHGLGGSRYETWEKNGVLWPQSILAQDFPKARIMTWGYDADVVRFFGPVGQGHLKDHAEDLNRDLLRERFEDYQVLRPIIFVAHSLGGLIVKQSLLLSDGERVKTPRERVDRRLAAIESSTTGVLFAGTPNQGANKMWVATATKLAWYIQKDHSDKVLNTLKRGSAVLEELQYKFGAIMKDFAIYTLIEDIGYPKVGRIVNEASALIGGQHEMKIYLHANHGDIVKFGENKENDYMKVGDAIGEIIKGRIERVRP